MSRLIRRMFDRATRTTPKRGRVARPVRSMADLKARLMCQPLEERLAPATLVVLNANDAGAGSLRQAILDANSNTLHPGADAIVFNGDPSATLDTSAGSVNFWDGTAHSVTFTGSTAVAITTADLSITGPGADLLTVKRSTTAAANRVIAVTTTNLNVTLANMTISGGSTSSAGGGLRLASGDFLTLSGVTVSGNTCTSSFGGGAMYMLSGSVLIQNSTISGNSASGSNGRADLHVWGRWGKRVQHHQ